MIASKLISDTIPPLKTSDTGEDAINWMSEFLVKHLPIVNNEQLLGLISEEDLLEQSNLSEPIGSYQLKFNNPYVHEDDHIYTVLRVASELRLSIIPVVDDEKNYKGLITLESLLFHFAQLSSITDPGGIIELQVPVRDYSLSEISRIVESNNANILSLYVTTHKDSTKMEITIKINKTMLRDVIATFERFEYEVLGYFQKTDFQNNAFKDRYDSLIKYLNI